MRSISRVVAVAGLAVLLACSTDGAGSPDIEFGSGVEIDYGGGEGPGPGEDAVEPDAEDDTGGNPYTGQEYPSAELLLKITGPTGFGFATTAGQRIALSGIVFGKFDSIAWFNLNNAFSGPVTGAPFWQTEGIDLVQGDNVIEVTAQGNGEVARERIVVTYNPGFMFPYAPDVRPPAVFAGENQEVHVTITLGPFGNLVSQDLTLQQVDKDGGLVQDLGAMKDDGALTVSGDEIAKDGVYTKQQNLPACQAGQPIYVRATAQVKDLYGQVYTAKSAPVPVDCVARLQKTTCAARKTVLANARNAYQAAIGAGVLAARQAAIDVLKADAGVQEVAEVTDQGGVWVQWSDGVLGAINVGTPDVRGGDGEPAEPFEAPAEEDGAVSSALVGDVIPVLSKNVLLLSPFSTEFGGADETQFIAKAASDVACPAYNVSGPYTGTAARLDRFRAMSDYGVVAVATHGETYFRTLTQAQKERYRWFHMGSQEVMWTGEDIACNKLTETTAACSSDADCTAFGGAKCMITKASYAGGTSAVSGVCHDATQVDVMSGRAIMGDTSWGVTPAFVLRHGAEHRYPDSLVYLGACRTLYNGSLGVAFFAAGAKAVAGYSNVVSSQFADQIGEHFFSRMIVDKEKAGSAYGVGSQDPAHPGSFFRFFGARALTVSEADILNQSFESGDLTAWEKEGDGRVITKLGVAKPVSGKFMGIISTGLGFTQQLGAIEQTFCIPPGLSTMSFYWKYYSEEFHEWCGSQYQDTFQATLADSKGKEYQVVNLAVDDLCKKGDNGCYTCGSKYVGLTPSDVQFDQGDNHKTDWQKATYNIVSLSGQGPVTLKFFCTDKGDSIYDTAVLVDHVKFE